MGLGPEDERVYEKFNRLLVPGKLKAFIESHPEFTWNPIAKKGMVITWAHGAQQPAEEGAPPQEGVPAPGFASASGDDVATPASSGDAATRTQAPPAPSFASASSAGPATKAASGGASSSHCGTAARTFDHVD